MENETKIPTFDELDREIWIRRTKLLYPEVDDFVIEMAVDAFIRNEGKDYDFDPIAGKEVKAKMFQENVYNPY